MFQKPDMFTRQFFNLLLDFNENWKVSSVDADYIEKEVYYYLFFMKDAGYY